jgi:hypothetical protein
MKALAALGLPSMLPDWVKAGAPEGPRQNTPAAPVFSNGWQLGPPDLIIQAKHPFSLPGFRPGRVLEFRS